MFVNNPTVTGVPFDLRKALQVVCVCVCAVVVIYYGANL